MTGRCEVCVLGKTAVTFADGRSPVTRFRTQKAAHLLAYLALHADRAHAREALIELLWPDAQPAAQRNNLSTALSILRRQIGDIFIADHATVRLDPERARVDATRFEALVRRGRHPGLSPGERRAALDDALALWAPPLPGVYDDWAIEVQTRLEALADAARDARAALPDTDAPTPPAAVPRPDDDPLPPTFARCLGRDDALVALGPLLSVPGLVTLTGPGGVGKTRLALEAARVCAAPFARTVFVSLAEIPHPALALSALRRALTDDPPADDPLAQTIDALNATPGATLLLLDNAEHLLPDAAARDADKAPLGIADLCLRLRARCPRLTVLATSRQPLGLSDERLFPVAPLPNDAAVALFVDRARLARPDFVLTEGNRDAIMGLCRQVDGLPLAIELAASWVRALSLPELRARLDDELLRLAGRRRDLPARHRSLEAALQGSWQRLTPPQRRLLAALSLLRGGGSFDAVAALDDAPDTIERLFDLIDHSLAIAEPGEGGATRYRLLETVRQFAAERLDASGERAAAERRHSAFFLARADEAEALLDGPGVARGVAILETEAGNFRAMLDRPTDADSLALLTVLAYHWMRSGNFAEGRTHLTKGLAWDGSHATPRVRAILLIGLGALERMQGDFTAALPHLEEACDLCRACDHPVGLAVALQHRGIIAQAQGRLADARTLYGESLATFRALHHPQAANLLNSLGIALTDEGRYDEAAAHLEESLSLQRAAGHRYMEAVVLVNLGALHLHRGETGPARACFEASLALQQALGDKSGVAGLHASLGHVTLREGDAAAARALGRESLQAFVALGDRPGMANALNLLAEVRAVEGDPSEATRLWAAAEALRSRLGVALPPLRQAALDTRLDAARAALGDGAFAASWQTGALWTPEEALAQVRAD